LKLCDFVVQQRAEVVSVTHVGASVVLRGMSRRGVRREVE
jgi:hypothetical protein